MSQPGPERRSYPIGCTSAYCGRTECEGCPALPELQAFKAWRKRTAARRPDEIWSPRLWEATKEGEKR